MTTPLRFKVADRDDEFEQVFRLNHRTFAGEIPQHAATADGRLVDRFHTENTYVVALEGERLVGMVAVRDRRPFSLDDKVHDLDSWLPKGRSVCEVRLLAIEPGCRRGRILPGLLANTIALCRSRGHDLAVASGTVRQTELYRRLGFEAFGPLVGSEAARYQPMYLTFESFVESDRSLLPEICAHEPISLLPGPVALSPEVRAAMAEPPISHRADAYHQRRRKVETALCHLTGARHAAVLLGSGTLANDVVAAQLAISGAPGLVVSNGEFGRRLVDHARRHRLQFSALELAWGERFDRERLDGAIAAAAARGARPRWLWAVACETSTGIDNDVARLLAWCRRHGIELCLDAVSAVGSQPIDLRDVWLATAASGKGLGSYPGLAIVFHRDHVAARPEDLPRYLDLGHHLACDGVPFTQSSNLMRALEVALERFVDATPLAAVRSLSGWLRPRLVELGMVLPFDAEHINPAVLTMRPPDGVDARKLGDQLRDEGVLVSYESGYLLDRGWLQVCLMGDCRLENLALLLQRLRRVLRRLRPRESGISWSGSVSSDG